MSEAERNVEGKVLTFRVGQGTYGIALESVYAVEDAGDRGADREVLYRGNTLPAIDLGDWFGGGDGEKDSFLIVGREKAEAALGVDSPGKVVQGLVRHRWPSSCRPLVEGMFEAVLQEGERLILMVDPEGLCRAACRQG